jgi:hypothetical protein
MRLFLFILLFPLWIFGQNNSVGGGDKQIVRMYDNVTASLSGTTQANVAGTNVTFNFAGITATNWPSVTYLIDFGTGFTDYGIGPVI